MNSASFILARGRRSVGHPVLWRPVDHCPRFNGNALYAVAVQPFGESIVPPNRRSTAGVVLVTRGQWQNAVGVSAYASSGESSCRVFVPCTTPDQTILWQWRFLHLNMTIVYTWVVMLLLTFVHGWSPLARSSGSAAKRWQNAFEIVVETIRGQIREVCPQGGDAHLPFIGTLFLFIAVAEPPGRDPGWHAPTGSLSTTAGLHHAGRGHMRCSESKARV